MDFLNGLFSVEDRIVVITGAGGSLAGALAEAFLQAGAKVALWGHRPESAKVLADKFTRFAASPKHLAAFAADTGDEDQVAAAFEKTRAALGTPNVLVNAVGGNRGKSAFVDTDLKLFDEIWRLNLTAGFLVPTKLFAARWLKFGQRGCSILNLASMGSYIPLSGVWAYNAAKAAVLNLTVGCAKEFGPAGIRVNALTPGFFLGQQNRSLLLDDAGGLTQRGQDILARTPFARFGEIRECQGAALFLTSEAAAGFVTGVSVPVDGGFLTDNI